MTRFLGCLVLVASLATAGEGPAKNIRFRPVPGQQINALVYFPDGKTVATIGLEGTLRLRTPATGKEIRTFPGQVSGWAAALTPDGKRIAAPAADGSIHLWEIATAKVVQELKGNAGTVWSLAISPDGKQLVSGNGFTARLWNLATGKEIRKFGPVQGEVWPVTFAPDGKRVAAGDGNGVLRLWSVATGKEVRRIQAHDRGVWPLVFSPDGKTLASCGWQGGTVRLWEAATGRKLRQFQVPPSDGWNLAFSADGRTLAAGGGDGAVHLWETASGKQRRRFAGHKGTVTAVAFAPGGRKVASGDPLGVVKEWDVTSLPPRFRLAARDLPGLWDRLKGTDADAAYSAVWKLTKAPQLTVPFLEKQLRPRPVKAPDPRRIARLIADLDHPQYRVRRRVTAALVKLGWHAEPALRRALAATPSLEARIRLDGLLRRLEAVRLSPDQMQALRALEVLEILGTPEARKKMSALARQQVDSWLRGEAKGALERLSRRAAKS
jgi:hypothetical protein